MSRVLILGATSAIAQHTARLFAREGDELFLVARDAQHLEAVAQDLRVRGARQVFTHVGDLASVGSHAAILTEASEKLGGFGIAIIAYGILPDQKKCEESADAALEAIHVNFTSVISWLTLLANYFEGHKSGTLAVIASVAGDRGRKSNYVYGAGKGALSLYLQGLRNRLYGSGVHVVTIKPGFVDTPMTAHLKKGFLFARPERVARKIYWAIVKKRDVVYAPGFWRYIMLVIRLIPERVFKRLSL